MSILTVVVVCVVVYLCLTVGLSLVRKAIEGLKRLG